MGFGGFWWVFLVDCCCCFRLFVDFVWCLWHVCCCFCLFGVFSRGFLMCFDGFLEVLFDYILNGFLWWFYRICFFVVLLTYNVFLEGILFGVVIMGCFVFMESVDYGS